MRDLIGRTLGHYRIVEKIGEGGMGQVYRARDERLDRDVAVKVLPEEMAADQSRLGRLQREAKALAALDHPGIVTIFSVEEADGIHFLTMAYVEGQTLGHLIPPEGMDVEPLLDFGVALADALRAAHERGIVHRDLKPSNVMVDREGRLRVLDFGLARMEETVPLSSQLETATLQEPMTHYGMVLGTIPYMSPEQAEGKPVGPSTDLFSLGVVLYEMATGSRPFGGETTASLISAILRDTPSAVTEVRPEVPAELGGVIQRCLEKAPGERYPSSEAVRDELEAVRRGVVSGTVTETVSKGPHRSRARALGLAAAAVILAAVVGTTVWRSGWVPGGNVGEAVVESAASQIRSIAVLPLRNLSGDPEQEYLVDGMTEALITGLSKIGALKVIARSSVMPFKGTEKPLSEIAAALGVDAVVEGSVIREGEQVGISAQLIEAASERVLWGEQYRRDLTSIFALQGEVAKAIADRIEVALAPEESRLLDSGNPVTAGAFEATLKGRFHLEQFTVQDFDAALRFFESALEIDPDYAPAYSGVADVWSYRKQWGLVEPDEAAVEIDQALARALELDDSLAEAHASLAGHKTWHEWDWEGGEEEFLRALELNPNLAGARIFYSHLLTILGRASEGTAQAERALELDPLNPFFQALQGVQQIMAGRIDEGIATCRSALENNPGLGFAHRPLWGAYFSKGLFEEAFVEVKAVFASAADQETVEALDRGWKEGGYVGAMRAAAELLELRSRTEFVAPSALAALYAYAGDSEKALEWLERGYEIRDPDMPYIGAFSFILVPDGRVGPRFQDLLRRMNLPED